MSTNHEAELAGKIAIVGTAGRFPAARSVRKFWHMLEQERCGTRFLTEDQLREAGVSERDLRDPNYVRAANILPDMEGFDASFFGFSPREAAILDPQHRHFLECCWEALEDAGHVPENFEGRIGVFAGSGMQAYLPYNLLTNPDLVQEIGLFLLRHTGNDKDFLTTRASYILNLQGPSMAVQTACSTSLVAVHQAAASLAAMECDMAIAGGVTIELPHRVGYRYAEGEILSPDGYCRAFDNDSQGTVFGSGIALVVLRRIEEALDDRDDIRAVILGSAINNDGAQKAGYLAPSVDGQAEAAAEALAVAGIAPETVTYVEAHGTGTPVGDPIELAALSEVYGSGGIGFCAIGSVKTNIGHLDTAAGAASLIKVVEAMRHGKLPASLNFRTPNTRFDFASSPFFVNDRTRDWPNGDSPRRAAVNSLGVGGTNAHLILEEAPPKPVTEPTTDWQIFTFSARDNAALARGRDDWVAYLETERPPLSDVSFTLRNGRRHFPSRLSVAANSHEQLEAALRGEARHLATEGRADGGDAPSIVFMFPGGGAQYPGAGAGLLKAAPVFADAVATCFSAMPDTAPPDLYTMMFQRGLDDQEARQKLLQSSYAIPAVFILEYAYAALWRSWGIEPDAIFGHSVGEYAGAVVAGALDVTDAVKIVTWRGRVMDAAPAGTMAVVPAGEADVLAVVGDDLDIAAVNAPGLSVVSGTMDAIEALEARLRGTATEVKRVQINVAAHSRILDGQLEPFRSGFDGIRFHDPSVPMISAMRGDWGQDGDFTTAEFWVRHLRQTVRFAEAVERILEEPGRIVIEVGPGQTLSPLVHLANARHPAVAVIPSAAPPNDEADEYGVALGALGGVWAHGVEIEWRRALGDTGKRISLPTYPFARTRHWIEPGRGAQPDDMSEAGEPELTRIEAIDDWFEVLTWKATPLPPSERRAGGTWLVFAGDDTLSAAVIARLAQMRVEVVIVRSANSFQRTDTGFEIRADEPEDYTELLDGLGAIPSQVLHLWEVDGDDPLVAFDHGFHLCAALQTRDLQNPIRLVFVVRGTAAPEGLATEPSGSVLLGPVRVAPREIPGLTTQLVDVSPDIDVDTAALTLIEEQAGEAADDRVLLRPNGRFTEHRNRVSATGPTGQPARLKSQGVYLITGGSGGIARVLARYLAETVKARVALLSRTGERPDGLADAISGAGGEFDEIAADIVDASATAAAIDRIRDRWGRIDGVFHAAGVIDDAPLAIKTRDAAHAVLAPKVEGARVLAEFFPDDGTLDFFAVFSSSSVTVAPPGQTDYVAANAYLESLAASRSDGLAVAWGVWRDVGMAARKYGAGDIGLPGPHPLLGPADRCGPGTTQFLSVIDPSGTWVVADHQVGSVPVMPGMAYLEIARAAYEACTSKHTCEILHLDWMVPLAFPEGLPRQIRVRLKEEDAYYQFSLESAAAGTSTFIEHARARVRALEGEERVCDRDWPDTLSVTARSGHPASSELIQFGPHWGRVKDIRAADDLAEAEVLLDECNVEGLQAYPVHPGLADMAATVGLNLLSEASSSEGLYAPASVERVQILGSLSSRVVGRARLREHVPQRLARFDATVRQSETGSPSIVFEGLEMRFVPASALASVADQDLGSTTDLLLARGISAAEAPEVFARLFQLQERHLIISPSSLGDVRARISRDLSARARPAQHGQSADGVKSDYADALEEKIAGLFGEILGGASVGPEDSFFDLGGHSLLAVRLFSRMRQDFSADLPLTSLFNARTPRKLRPLIVEANPSLDVPATPQVTSEAEMEEDAHEEVRETETTEAQREIFSAILIDPEVSLAYNLSFSLHVSGEIDVDAMRRSLETVVNHHPSLRTTFDTSGLLLKISRSSQIELVVEDLTSVPEAVREERTATLRREAVETPFDLFSGPVLRAQLILLASDRCELLLCVHHIVCDGWSIGILMEDLSRCYTALARGETPRLPPATGIAEYVAATKAWHETPAAEAHRAFWLNAFSGDPPAIDVPTDHPRPPVKTTNGARFDSLLEREVEERLRTVAATEGATLQNLIFAAFKVYLGRITGTNDIVVGLPTSGQLANGMERTIGHCVNFLPIRSKLSPTMPFTSFVGEARLRILEAMDHQNFTYGELVRELKLPRDPSRVLLVPVIFNIDNLTDINNLRYGELETNFQMHPRLHEHFEIFLNLLDEPGAVSLFWSYNSDLFDRTTIEKHADRFLRLLEGLAEAPATPLGKVGRFLTNEATPASGQFEDPGAVGPQTIPEVFRSVATRYAGSVALRFGEQTMTYADLDLRSDALAAELNGRGVRTGDLVGISSRRRLELIVAVVGALKAGAGYVPFDVALPAERQRFMAEDTGIKVLLGSCPPVSEAGVDTIPFDEFPVEPTTPPPSDVDGEAVAYVMFTSGTTGRPKGVVLPHRSVIRLLIDTDWVRLGPKTVTLHSSAFAFDTSIIDIFGALLHGGEVVIPPDGQLSISELGEAIASHGVNTLWLTSGLFHAVADTRPAVFAAVDQLIVGGDVVSPVQVAKVRKACPGLTVINGYGPTESNVCNAHTITDVDIASGEALPIGRAVPGTQIFIVDDNLNPVEPGVKGELCIAGRGLALGYWNRPELTAEKFVTAPWDPSLVLYRSGDLASDPGDGVLRFHGRKDTQVKVRGFRIELGEVETALESHPQVRQAAVVATLLQGQFDKVLAAFFVAEVSPPPSRRSLSEHLKSMLPEYARPSYFVAVDALPLNRNGKIDRSELPQLDPTALAEDRTAADTATEHELEAIWCDVLGLKEVGVEANFFELGGHSLLAVRLFDTIRKRYGLDMPISTLFQNPTIRDLAATIDASRSSAPASIAADEDWDTSTVIHPGPGTGAKALFIVGGVGGNVNNLYELGTKIGKQRPVIGIQTRGVLGHTPRDSIEEMAVENIRYMRHHQASGPYNLVGYSGGALTALEIARQLRAAGEGVSQLIILDTFAPGIAKNFRPDVKITISQRIKGELEILKRYGVANLLDRLRLKLRGDIRRSWLLPLLRYTSPSTYRFGKMEAIWLNAAASYRGGPLDAQITLILTDPRTLTDKIFKEQNPYLGWSEIADGNSVHRVFVAGDHRSMLRGEGAEGVARAVEERLSQFD